MDRENTPIAKCQGGFIKIIVTPLYEAWSAFAQSATSKEAVENCNMNLEQWNVSRSLVSPAAALPRCRATRSECAASQRDRTQQLAEAPTRRAPLAPLAFLLHFTAGRRRLAHRRVGGVEADHA